MGCVEGFELPPDIRDAIKRAAEIARSPAARAAVDATAHVRQYLASGVAEQPRQAMLSWQRSIVTIAPTIEQLNLQLPKLSVQLPKAVDFTAQYGPVLAEIARHFRDAWRRAMPPNWVDLDSSEVMAVVDRVRVTGFTLAWIPRVEIVREVLAAEPEDTGAVLMARLADVLDDAEACIAEASAQDLLLIRTAVEKSISALRDGHDWAAQALAASAFCSESHEWFRMGTKAIRKRMADEDPKDAGIDELRLRTIFLAGSRAFEEFRPDTGRPVRRQFNRHNTAHRITPEQWNEQNALCAVILAAALLREMEYWWGADEEPQEDPEHQ